MTVLCCVVRYVLYCQGMNPLAGQWELLAEHSPSWCVPLSMVLKVLTRLWCVVTTFEPLAGRRHLPAVHPHPGTCLHVLW